MSRWLLGIEYDGHPFCGWQKQPNVITVQGVLEAALTKVACEDIRVHAAGRTDTGVHATGQVVHFQTSVTRSSMAWVRGVNRYLPDAVRVLYAHQVDEGFHARRSALSRRYRYILYQHAIRPALYAHRVSWTHHSLDEERIRQTLPKLIGTHDFSAFRSAECQAISPIRHVIDIQLTHVDEFWVFEIEANAFLHHMVRNFIGVFIDIGRGLRDPSWILELLKQKDRRLASPTAPPEGLYLLSVQYPAEYSLPFLGRVIHGYDDPDGLSSSPSQKEI